MTVRVPLEWLSAKPGMRTIGRNEHCGGVESAKTLMHFVTFVWTKPYVFDQIGV